MPTPDETRERLLAAADTRALTPTERGQLRAARLATTEAHQLARIDRVLGPRSTTPGTPGGVA